MVEKTSWGVGSSGFISPCLKLMAVGSLYAGANWKQIMLMMTANLSFSTLLSMWNAKVIVKEI